jgi:hypothetical protein
MTNETIALAANIALTLSLVVALVFGIAQVRAAARDRRERLTLEALRSFQTRDFAELMQYVTNHEMPDTREDLGRLPAGEQVYFMQFAQEMEMLGILVAEKYINLDLVDKTLGSYVSTSWEKYSKLFVPMRETLPDPFLGEYFQWLAEAIQKRMRDHPRKPFHEEARYR